jgi:hypothetical protein
VTDSRHRPTIISVLIYFVTGEFDRYIDTQQKALELAREVEDYSYQLQIYQKPPHRLPTNHEIMISLDSISIRAAELASSD